MFIKITKYSFFLLIFCVFIEIIFSGLFPDLARNQIHKDIDEDETRTITKSINSWHTKFDHIPEVLWYRHHNKKSQYYKNNKKESFNKEIYIFGDSVSGGFGVNLKDSYFDVAEDLIKQTINPNINVYSVSGHGHNFSHLKLGIKKLDKILKDGDIIIYQFNYNDIGPHNYKIDEVDKVDKVDEVDEVDKVDEVDEVVKVIKKPKSSSEPTKLKIIFNDFRKGYLNKSAFMRTMQHYAGIIKWNLGRVESPKNIILQRRLFKKCGNLGYTTLGQYTFAYGAEQYQELSNRYWFKFEKELIKLNKYLKSKNLKFATLISPISLQVQHHERINARNLNFKCSTINAVEKINKILRDNDIDIIDPLEDFSRYTKTLNQNQNNSFLFHPFDTNHPNAIGHIIMGKKLYFYLNSLLKS